MDPTTLEDVVVDSATLEARLEWQNAALAQKKALRAAHTKAKEAQARHQIERRLFCEGLYLGAAAEFDWLVACSGPPDVPAQPGLRTTRAGPGAPGPPAKPVRRHRIQATKCSGP